MVSDQVFTEKVKYSHLIQGLTLLSVLQRSSTHWRSHISRNAATCIPEATPEPFV